MARRKRLLGIATLEAGIKLHKLGVPMTKIHEQLGLQGKWSYPSTVTVLNAELAGLTDATRPPWLQDEPLLQEMPTNWAFRGIFPDGKWVKLKS